MQMSIILRFECVEYKCTIDHIVLSHTVPSYVCVCMQVVRPPLLIAALGTHLPIVHQLLASGTGTSVNEHVDVSVLVEMSRCLDV